MFIVTVNKDLYRYEIQALVKAFYPAEEVKVLPEEDYPEAPFLTVKYEKKKIVATVLPGEENSFCREVNGTKEDLFTEKSKASKDALKHLVYETMASYTGRDLPWGELIGIRPTKIARKKREEGCSVEETESYLQKEHFVSKEKARLAVEIADRERKVLLSTRGKEGFSLYIGIPFCPTTCLYCSFPSNSITMWKDRVEDYLDTLILEVNRVSEGLTNTAPDSIYIGGGTPTTLSAAQLDRLLTETEACFSKKNCLEYTVEAGRPDSITGEKLRVLKRHGVDRISINPQSMRAETLSRIGRGHSPEDIEKAFALAREEGFSNINMDIILGLPGEDPNDVRYTLEKISALRPESLTVHTLAVKRGSRLEEKIREEGYDKVLREETTGMDDPIEEMMEACHAACEKMRMVPYYLYRQKNLRGNHENIGFAKEDRFGIYNSLIIEETQSILAFGAGSISKAVCPDGKILRSEDPRDIETYLSHIGDFIAKKRELFWFL